MRIRKSEIDCAEVNAACSAAYKIGCCQAIILHPERSSSAHRCRKIWTLTVGDQAPAALRARSSGLIASPSARTVLLPLKPARRWVYHL